MNAEISESIQHAISPGECKDLYYPGRENSELQCFPTVVNNRFYASLPALNGGATNTLIFNPDQGVSDMVLTVSLPTSGVSYAGWAFPKGWLSAMIFQVGLRIGGSALYSFTGDQMLVDTLSDCEDEGKKQAVFNLAGGELLTAPQFADPVQTTASVYIKLPYNTISALQKTLPLPSDLLTQPVQVLIQFKQFSDVAYWYGAGQPNYANLCSSFSSAQVNYKQTTIQNSEHLLARRTDMNVRALAYPLRYFSQTTFRTQFPFVPTQSSINLTGFRQGSVKYMNAWFRATDAQPFDWISPVAVQVLINGLVYYDSRQNNSQLWNLCDRKTTAQVDNTVLSTTLPAQTPALTPTTTPWTVIPFGQDSEPMAYCNEVVLGAPISNSVVNLYVTLPATHNGVALAGKTIECSVSYAYACSLMFSKGTAEYVF